MLTNTTRSFTKVARKRRFDHSERGKILIVSNRIEQFLCINANLPGLIKRSPRLLYFTTIITWCHDFLSLSGTEDAYEVPSDFLIRLGLSLC